MEPHVKYRRPRWKKVSSHLAAAVGTVMIASATPQAYAAPAGGEETGSSESALSKLVNAATSKEAQASDLELSLGTLREDVNRALVDLHDSQVAAETARLNAKNARNDLTAVDSEVVSAQGEFSKIAQSAFNQGATAGQPMYAGADNVGDALDRSTFLRGDAAKQSKIIDDLDKKRTEQANSESKLRVARTDAETAETQAKTAQTTAQTKLSDAETELSKVSAERDQAIAERDLAQAKLKAAREALAKLETDPAATPGAKQSKENEVAQQAADSVGKSDGAQQTPQQAQPQPAPQQTEPQPAAPTGQNSQPQSSQPQSSQQDNTAFAAPAGGQGDTATAADGSGSSDSLNAALQLALQVANEMGNGQLDHTQTDNPFPSASDIDANTPSGITIPNAEETGTTGTAGASGAPDSATSESESAQPDSSESGTAKSGASEKSTKTSSKVSGMSRDQEIEVVINRAMSQKGQPYAWGGGNATGPTKGIRDGGVADRYGDYNKVGFDCSGLTLYAYAGLGIDLPHYTGYQYQRGTHVPASQMQRGDLIFYGPEGNGHVAIALGDGTMIEAPQSGGVVQVSPVRWGGMTPNVVRLV